MLEGDFYSFEQSLHKFILELYDKICDAMRDELSRSASFEKIQREIGRKKGLKKLVKRDVELQLRTGKKIKYKSLYAKVASNRYEDSRHLFHLHWKVDKKSGPMYQSIMCLLSVICPSFSVSKSILNYLCLLYTSPSPRDS